MLGLGLVLLAAGIVTMVRGMRGDPANQRAVYGRRIVGMMLAGGGLTLTAFQIALRAWS